MRPAEGKIAARFPAKISACLALRTAFNSIREMDAAKSGHLVAVLRELVVGQHETALKKFKARVRRMRG